MSKTIQKQDVKNVAALQNNAVAVKEEDLLSPELMALLEDKVPAFVKEYAADGTAILQWNHEFLIMIEEVLRLEFDFDEDSLVKLEQHIKELMPIAHHMKKGDTKLLRKNDFAVAMEMVKINKANFKARQAGITLPSGELKKLK